MSMNEFWDIASPTTLASLIADIEAADYGDSGRQMFFALHRDANQALIANVGEDEAKELIAAAAGHPRFAFA